MSDRTIPALLMAAPASGSGKTTLTCALLAALKNRGLTVQAYKVGPDYIDPGYLAAASGRPAHNLDTWLTDAETMRNIFAETSQGADIAVIEGVMGLYDGGCGGVSSSAEIAGELGVPAVLVMDARSMGASAAALALGFRDYDKNVNIAGVILNKLGSENHRRLVAEAMERIGMPVLGAVPRDEEFSMPERHLGLLPKDENSDRAQMQKLAALAEKHLDLEALLRAAAASRARSGRTPAACAPKQVRIAVARDQAFSFYYPESLAALERAGAELTFFSPLADKALPEADGAIFGGGFPEVFAPQLSANVSMRASVAAAARAGLPIYAECGGYMYLTRGIADFEGKMHPMAAVVPICCRMRDKLKTVGYVEAESLGDNILCCGGTVLRGHEFHFSSADREESLPNAFLFTKMSSGEKYAGGYASGNVLASYLHLHFAGNPQLAASFAASCRQWRRTHKLKTAAGW